jgi:hypothetical protein
VVYNIFVRSDLSQVYCLYFVVLEGQGFPYILVKLYCLGGMVLLSRFLNLTRLQNINFVSHVFDDSSMILLFPLHIFFIQ